MIVYHKGNSKLGRDFAYETVLLGVCEMQTKSVLWSLQQELVKDNTIRSRWSKYWRCNIPDQCLDVRKNKRAGVTDSSRFGARVHLIWDVVRISGLARSPGNVLKTRLSELRSMTIFGVKSRNYFGDIYIYDNISRSATFLTGHQAD